MLLSSPCKSMKEDFHLVVRCENGNKRRRLYIYDEEELEPVPEYEALALCDMVLDVLVHVLKFLPLGDLDNFAIASSRCSEARNHFSLDQTRTGSIVVNGAMNQSTRRLWDATTFLQEVSCRRWNDAFQGNRTRLRIGGLDSVESSKMSDVLKLSKWIKLEKVTYLDASFHLALDAPFRKVKNCVGKSLAQILPNLRELDMSYMKVTETAVNTFAKYCPNLEVFRWNGSDDGLRLTGQNLAKCKNLKEVYLEDSRLYCSIRRNANNYFMFQDDNDVYAAIQVLCFCSSKLERVSIKGSKWYSWDVNMSYPLGKGPVADIPQSAMIRFVERTPTLKWFRSDLSSENISILQKKFPGIEFC